MLHKFIDYIKLLPIRIRVEKNKYSDEKAEVPFEMKDPKILHIFIAWGGLLVGASFVFLIESLSDLLLFLSFILVTFLAELAKAALRLRVRMAPAISFTWDFAKSLFLRHFRLVLKYILHILELDFNRIFHQVLKQVIRPV
jgi:hypothetical protein